MLHVAQHLFVFFFLFFNDMELRGAAARGAPM
jgi:hypothetical protein